MEEPKIPQKAPYVQDAEPRKYAWCSCGQSSNQPFCDGSHKGSSFTPVVVEITEEKKVAWCGCKKSANQPFCDGTHSKI